MDNENVDRELHMFVFETLTTLTPDDYLFTAQVDTPWDVYRFRSSRGDGTVAFRMVDRTDGRKAEIGFFRRGSFTPDEVTSALARDAPS